jgi:hypothetical protein
VYVVVTDVNVGKLYSEGLVKGLEALGTNFGI